MATRPNRWASLFQSKHTPGRHGAGGSACRFPGVEERYEAVVDEFLRDELNYIVVKSWDVADEGLRLLRTDVDGRATFLMHPEDSQAKFSFVLDESGRRPLPPGQVLPLRTASRAHGLASLWK